LVNDTGATGGQRRRRPHCDEHGVIRVVGSRVTLDTVCAAFENGATAEEISQRYPSVDLATTYAVLACVLANKEKVDAYLQRTRAEAELMRKEIERRFDPIGLRARLLARRRGV
jgi:uncharacterized protein (DUF433 family)